jgi:hypothetical protein
VSSFGCLVVGVGVEIVVDDDVYVVDCFGK